MKDELDNQLVAKYPELFVNKNKSPMETLICFGCECGDGWYSILDYLFGYLTALSKRKIPLDYTEEYRLKHKDKKDYYENYYSYKHLPPQIVLDQVKEKYATLRVYYHLEYNEIPEELKANIVLTQLDKELETYYTAIDNAIEFAEYQTSRTCEVTGKPGKLYTKGWYRVLCDEEAAKAGYTVNEGTEWFVERL